MFHFPRVNFENMPDIAHPTKAPPQVPCPTCQTMTVFAPQNPWRPFCSQRCKHIDLGAWASEDFRVAVAEPDPGSQQ